MSIYFNTTESNGNKQGLLDKIGAEHLEDGIKDCSYTHVQTVYAAIWTINHGFGRVPNITIRQGEKITLISPEHIIESDGQTCNTSIVTWDNLEIGEAVCS